MLGVNHASRTKESLPTLRLSTTQEPLSCSNCGKPTNALLPVCLWCFSDDKLEDPARRRSSNQVPSQKGVTPYGIRDTEFLSRSQASASTDFSPIQHTAAQQPMLIARSHLSVDLRDESLMDALSATFPSLLKQDDTQVKQERLAKSDYDASVRLIAPKVAQSEDKDVAMFHPSIPNATSLDPSEAGSSPPTSRSLRFRSRSLFSLTISNTPQQTTTSTTSSMINVARSVTRRISSSAQLRTQPMPEHESYKHEEKQLVNDNHEDAFASNNRSLRRKKRLDTAAPQLPPLPTSYSLKRGSKTSLHTPPPIAISLSLNESRPGTAESSNSFSLDTTKRNPERVSAKSTPVPHNADEIVPETVKKPLSPAPPLPTSVPEKEVRPSAIRWSTDDRREPLESSTRVPPIPNAHSPSSSRPKLTGILVPSPTLGPQDMPQIVTPVRPSPSSSRQNSISSQSPRLGHPSRPYYSAIRKHCMSSPASSRPSSVDHGVNFSLASAPALANGRDRPTSTSGAHPPSAFSMSGVTPFTRRPVSIGAVPSSSASVPASVPQVASSSRAGSISRGMSVFDIEDCDEEEEVVLEEWDRKKGKSNSLSRAFQRGSTGPATGKKRRRWSSSLFSESNVKDGDSKVDRIESKRTSQTVHMDRQGISMSGEMELRMALALMQQEEEEREATRLRQLQQDQSEGEASGEQTDGVVPQRRDKERKYRFRQTVDFSVQDHVAPPIVGLVGEGGEGEGQSGKGKGRRDGNDHHQNQQQSGVLDKMKKLKRGLKGLLTSSNTPTPL